MRVFLSNQLRLGARFSKGGAITKSRFVGMVAIWQLRRLTGAAI